MNELLEKAAQGMDFVVSDLSNLHRQSTPIMEIVTVELHKEAVALQRKIECLLARYKDEQRGSSTVEDLLVWKE